MYLSHTIFVVAIVVVVAFWWCYGDGGSYTPELQCNKVKFNEKCNDIEEYTDGGIENRQHFGISTFSISDLLQFGELQVYEDIGVSNIQTADERFAAAKRNVPENRMRTGIVSTKARRQQLDSILRRASNTKSKSRPRRNEKDFALMLRGDNIPKYEHSWSINKPKFGVDTLEKGIFCNSSDRIPPSVSDSLNLSP